MQGVTRALTTWLVVAAWFLGLGLIRWNLGLATSYDYGIFAQSAQAYAHLQPPVSTIRGINLLGDHFSPITALWGLAWLVWPDPRALLVVQALCLAGGVVVAAETARALLPRARWFGWVVVASGALGGQVLGAALFDVHEVSFGFPLVALLASGLLRQRPAAVLGAAAGLVLVKEDLGSMVVMAAVLWWFTGPRTHRWVAVALASIGVGGFLLAVTTVAAINPAGSSPYTGNVLFSPIAASWADVPSTILTTRLAPLGLFVLTAGVFGVTSRVALLALPTLTWRLVSSVSTHALVGFHYDLLLWPIATLALVDAWARSTPGHPDRRAPTPAFVAAGLALLLSIVVGIAHLEQRSVRVQGLSGESTKVRSIRAAAAAIPAGSAVGATNDIGPYLVADQRVYHLGSGGWASGEVAYLVVPTQGTSAYGLSGCARAQLDGLLASGGATLVAAEPGVEAYRLDPPTSRVAHGC